MEIQSDSVEFMAFFINRLNKNFSAWLLCLGVFFAAAIWQGTSLLHKTSETGTALNGSWDPNFYFMWARSLVIDGDIDFENDVSYVANHPGIGWGQERFSKYLESPLTDTGLIPNKYPLGLGLLSVPALSVVNLTVPSLVNQDPFSHYYYIAFILTSIFIACVGLFTAVTMLNQQYGGLTTTLAAGSVLLGLSLGYYILIEAGMSHAASFGCVTLFIAASISWTKQLINYSSTKTYKTLVGPAAILGLLYGLCILVRFTNGAFIIIPFILAVMAWVEQERNNLSTWFRGALFSLAVTVLVAILVVLPQLIAWNTLYGSPLVYSYAGEEIGWFPKHALSVLFGPYNSLFLWTPLSILCVTGLILGAAKRNSICVAGLATFIATTWIYGGWGEPGLGSAFGMRGFVDISFFFMLGLAELFRQSLASGTIFSRGLMGVVAVLLAWNVYFMICYRAEIQPHGEPFAGKNLFAHGNRWINQLKTDSGWYLLTGRENEITTSVDND